MKICIKNARYENPYYIDQLKATRIFRKITEPYANNITYIKVGLESKNVLPGPRNND